MGRSGKTNHRKNTNEIFGLEDLDVEK